MHVLAHHVSLETLKLLIQVAWADHEITAEEVAHILSLARQVEATDDEIEFIQRALSDEGRLPAPNLEILRGHYDEVMGAIDQMIAVDRHIVDDERAVRDTVAQMLSKK